MAFRFERDERLADAVRRVATEALDDAIGRLAATSPLDGADVPDAATVETHVHEVRKRCKEVRGLLRLVRPTLGREAVRANREIAAAARRLAPFRDAHALLGTLDDLIAAHADDAAAPLRAGAVAAVRSGQAARAAAATAAIHGGDERLVAARAELEAVRSRVHRWKLGDTFAAIEPGLRASYRTGRQAMRLAGDDTHDEAMHEWRKFAKHLWYELRLLEKTAPSALGPMVDSLDVLGEALGDDHDLGVLVAAMNERPDDFGGRAAVDVVAELARQEQAQLRDRAFRLGARVYAERPRAFTDRVRAYWEVDRSVGRELRTGGIEELADQRRDARRTERDAPSPSTVERERKFLVASMPELDGGVELRQGYLALDGGVAVRVRSDASGRCTLTLKGGRGATRTEVEHPLDPAEFEALWALTGERRVVKTRHEVTLDLDLVAEVDVFAGSLDGLVLVEVEFGSDEALAAFVPPSWFGPEVTDDDRYSNASLALSGVVPAEG